jgi:hypothetical protein
VQKRLDRPPYAPTHVAPSSLCPAPMRGFVLSPPIVGDKRWTATDRSCFALQSRRRRQRGDCHAFQGNDCLCAGKFSGRKRYGHLSSCEIVDRALRQSALVSLSNLQYTPTQTGRFNSNEAYCQAGYIARPLDPCPQGYELVLRANGRRARPRRASDRPARCPTGCLAS